MKWTRMIALAAVLALPLAGSTARAQDPGAEGGGEGGNSGRPLDGYFGGAILSSLALFLVAKSARR